MWIEFIKKEKKWLGISLTGGFLLSLGVLLLSFFYQMDGLDILGIWLFGILSSSGAFPLVLVFLGLSLLGGVVGMLLIGGIRLIQSCSKGTEPSPFEADDVLDSDRRGDLSSHHELVPSKTTNDSSVELTAEGISGDIEAFKAWGEEICGWLLEKARNELAEEALRQYEEEMPKLKQWFYRLAREVHPDKNIDLEAEQKLHRQEQCKDLLNSYRAIKEQWEAALKGIDLRQQTTVFASSSYSHEEFSAELESLRKWFYEELARRDEQLARRDEEIARDNARRDEEIARDNARRDEQLAQRLADIESRIGNPVQQPSKFCCLF